MLRRRLQETGLAEIGRVSGPVKADFSVQSLTVLFPAVIFCEFRSFPLPISCFALTMQDRNTYKAEG